MRIDSLFAGVDGSLNVEGSYRSWMQINADSIAYKYTKQDCYLIYNSGCYTISIVDIVSKSLSK